MHIYILLSILTRLLQILTHGVAAHPLPVVGPNMAVDVRHLINSVYTLAEIHIPLTTVEALRACRDHMVGVELADKLCTCLNPLGKSLLVVLLLAAEGARLVRYLP